MLLRHQKNSNKVQFVYKFVTEEKFVTSPWIDLGVSNNGHLNQLLIMREFSLIFSNNWLDLNEVAKKLEQNPTPAKEEVIAWAKEIMSEEQFDMCYTSWYSHPHGL